MKKMVYTRVLKKSQIRKNHIKKKIKKSRYTYDDSYDDDYDNSDCNSNYSSNCDKVGKSVVSDIVDGDT